MVAMPVLRFPMVDPRRNMLPIAVLLVYLTSIISGGLHHHDASGDDNAPAANSGPASLEDCQSEVNSQPAPSGEESDDCSICIASHQAKAPSGGICLAVAYASVGETVRISVESPIVFGPLVQQARAPPAL
jgi:hypothetical protein